MDRCSHFFRPGRGRPGRFLALLLSSALWPGAGAAQEGSEQLRMMETHLDEARATAVHLLAPRAFGQALDRFEDAAHRFEDGRTDEDFQDLLAEAHGRLEDAERIADAARPLFAETLAMRSTATSAQAEMRAAQAWGRAEAELEDAGRRFEREDPDEAAIRADRAAELYRRAARAGWRDLFLGSAMEARQVALNAGASDLAPRAFAEGESLLASGEAEIEGDRANEGTAAIGAEAVAAFARASWIAALADSVRRREVTVERLVDEHEADLARLAASANIASERGDTGGTAERIEVEIGRLRDENLRLEAGLRDAQARAADLTTRVATLEGQLGEARQRFAETRDDLLAIRERDDRLREAQGLFTPEEGEVLLSGDQLVLRLFGLTFGSGEAEIDEAFYPLLTKVQRVITTFEGAGVRIEGHTDSQGGAQANQALSQRRAIAVREHLLARVPIPSSRVEAVGLGEDQPIASNETEEGRARNRRIEVVVTLAGG